MASLRAGRLSLATALSPCSCSRSLVLPVRGRVFLSRTSVRAAASGPFNSSFDSLWADVERELDKFDDLSAFLRQKLNERTPYQADRDFSYENFQLPEFDALAERSRAEQRQAVAPERGWRLQSQGSNAWGRSYFVEVTTYGSAQPQAAPALQLPSAPLLFGLAVLVGAYLTSVRIFLRNYHLTSFAENKRLLLAVAGPLLALISPRFKKQWAAALHGERVPVKARFT